MGQVTLLVWAMAGGAIKSWRGDRVQASVMGVRYTSLDRRYYKARCAKRLGRECTKILKFLKVEMVRRSRCTYFCVSEWFEYAVKFVHSIINGSPISSSIRFPHSIVFLPSICFPKSIRFLPFIRFLWNFKNGTRKCQPVSTKTK